jgi:pimeloyl-ACP methyl ester carboxylesterase
VRQDVPVDGFRLAYQRAGQGAAVLLLHGWPGDRADYRDVLPLVSPSAEVVLPDLRGFGESDKHPADPAGEYSAAAQAKAAHSKAAHAKAPARARKRAHHRHSHQPGSDPVTRYITGQPGNRRAGSLPPAALGRLV